MCYIFLSHLLLKNPILSKNYSSFINWEKKILMPELHGPWNEMHEGPAEPTTHWVLVIMYP